MYPTRDGNFAKAAEQRLHQDSRAKVYGTNPGSLLIQHSYPELLLSTHHHSHSNNYTAHSPHKQMPPHWEPISISSYKINKKIGSGTYGSVFHALSPSRGEVAIKQLCPMHNEKASQDGFHITAIREIKILKALEHTNIISLHDVLCCEENVMADFIAKDPSTSSKHSKYKPNGRMQTYMVFEYMHHDLSGLLHNEHVHFTIEHIKYFMCQLLNALQYCHDIAHILHRDIKSSNLLVDNNGVLKIADFGLARQFIPTLTIDNEQVAAVHASVNHKHPRHYTNRVVTLWYRAPELLLSDVHYTPAVDMWSVGCVFAELLFNKPIFTGKNEMEQWFQIIEVCGWNCERESAWTSTLRDKDGLVAAMKSKSKPFPRKLKSKFAHFLKTELVDKRKNAKYLDEEGFKLLDALLTVNPTKRVSAKDGASSPWFRSQPVANPPNLSRYQSSHDYEQRQLRKNANYNKNANHFNPNYRRNNSSSNGNNGKARYSYNAYVNSSTSSTTNNSNRKLNGTANGHGANRMHPHRSNHSHQFRQNRNGGRGRSRSRSRERKGSAANTAGNRTRSVSLGGSNSSKEGSVVLPPPIQRLAPLHPQPSHSQAPPPIGVPPGGSNKPMVVTLQAPSLNTMKRPNQMNGNHAPNPNVRNGFNATNGPRNGFNKQWNNNKAGSQTFYSRFKKPDELKGRSRF